MDYEQFLKNKQFKQVDVAKKNLNKAIEEKNQIDIFDLGL